MPARRCPKSIFSPSRAFYRGKNGTAASDAFSLSLSFLFKVFPSLAKSLARREARRKRKMKSNPGGEEALLSLSSVNIRRVKMRSQVNETNHPIIQFRARDGASSQSARRNRRRMAKRSQSLLSGFFNGTRKRPFK